MPFAVVAAVLCSVVMQQSFAAWAKFISCYVMRFRLSNMTVCPNRNAAPVIMAIDNWWIHTQNVKQFNILNLFVGWSHFWARMSFSKLDCKACLIAVRMPNQSVSERHCCRRDVIRCSVSHEWQTSYSQSTLFFITILSSEKIQQLVTQNTCIIF